MHFHGLGVVDCGTVVHRLCLQVVKRRLTKSVVWSPVVNGDAQGAVFHVFGEM